MKKWDADTFGPLARLNVRLRPRGDILNSLNSLLFDLLNPSHAFHRLVYSSWDRSLMMFESFYSSADGEMSIYNRIVMSKVRWNWDSFQFWTSSTRLSVKTYTNKPTFNMSSPMNKSVAKCCIVFRLIIFGFHRMILGWFLNCFSPGFYVSPSLSGNKDVEKIMAQTWILLRFSSHPVYLCMQYCSSE